jgi:phosphate transport system protein
MHRQLNREIEKLKQHVLKLGAQVEAAVFDALTACREHRRDLAEAVVAGDSAIDQAEIDLEEECLKLFALYQPVAGDLRFLVAVLKINNDLERIGDLAVNIAERAVFLADHPLPAFPFDFTRMAEVTARMLRQSLDALSSGRLEPAQEVAAMDDEVDGINRAMYRQVQDAMRADPDRIGSLIQVLGISRSLERIADHATDIAEDVVYMASGEIVRHPTLPGDRRRSLGGIGTIPPRRT